MRAHTLSTLLLLALTSAACTAKDSTSDDSGADDSASDDSGADDSAAPENTPPTAPVVAVNPSAPFADDALSCELLEDSEDADGDAVSYSYSWTVDGADAGISTDTVPAERTAEGESWTCTVTPDDGTEAGAPGQASTTIERCSGLHFDGQDDLVTLGDVDWDTFTIEAWVYIDDPSGLHAIASDLVNSGGHVYQNVELSVNEGKLMLSLGDTSGWTHLGSAGDLSAGQWHHVAGMYDGSTASLAIDGVIDPNTAAVNMVQEDTPLYIGARPDNQGETSFYFDGVIDGLRISQGARYTSDFTPSLALRADGDTLALWSMDEGSGADLGDGAGGLDGAIDGATWSAGCAAIDNAAPGAPGLAISPEAPTQLDDLVCAVDVASTDADGDAVSYAWRWWVDGVDAGVGGDTVDAALTEIGETWTCEVTPFDGKVDGPSGSASVEILPCVALDFDGVDDHVELGDVDWSVFTVEAWVYIDDSSSLHAIVSDLWNSGSHVYRNVELSVNAGNLMLSLGDTRGWTHLRSAGTLSTGQWHHVAGVYDGSTASLAIDGVIDANTATVSMVQEDTPLFIGGRPDNQGEPAFFFDGRIASVRVSSTARYASDFTPGFPLDSDGDTQAFWALSEGTGSTAWASPGEDGEILGATWVEECP
ncbi:MAG: LamG domain-containing protein [Alphaproteobacteria bacterium]|nr:LamG domain-containing protein [Alphaproteobacteria bacterium]MCB9792195.1 LamG domain-containing protein [Alphaproteobacteria bacterium]